MEPLKLAVFDAEDLAVVSAHLQDAVIRVGDIAFLPAAHRFALVLRRFDWEASGKQPRRRLAGLHFEGVQAVRTRGIDRARPDDVLNLLAVTFEPGDPPAGRIRLVFAGGACLQLEVDWLEASLKDLGPVWAAKRRPIHDLESA
ncbi:MAG: hypothetical protein JWR08_684 [Enterovirga sp.]|jgi:hypothetical protein|nr:hypothetical protein [Enterovirga sp.]